MAKTEILSPAVRVKINNEWVELPALKGEKGDAASTIRVGEVRSGSTASVVNSGTVNDVVLDFVLPKGDRGEAGKDGVNGKDGKDGYTPIKGVDYFDGKNGKDGYTPIKGVDYFDGKNGKDGKDGYTPIKGVDYFDGRDGVDGINGKDGRDGVDAPVFTFEMNRKLYVEALDRTYLRGSLIVNGEKSSSYTPRAYYKDSSSSPEWNETHVTLGEGWFEAIFQGKDIREVKFDFYDGEKLVYSHYIQFPKDGKDGSVAPVYTFQVERFWYDEAHQSKVLEGYFLVNKNKNNLLYLKGYYKNDSMNDWSELGEEDWTKTSHGYEILFPSNDDLREIRLDFYNPTSEGLEFVYSHYMQIPKDGINGKDGVDGINGKDGVDGKDAPVFTFEVEELWYDERVYYTVLKGYLVVNGERKSDYEVNAYYRSNIGGDWEANHPHSWDASNNELLVMFSNPKNDLKEIRLDFLKNNSVLYSYYMQYVRDGKTGESATVQVGTVTEGDTVSVVNVGDEHNAILNFTLKKGKDYEIEVRDAVSLVKGGMSLDEARTAIGVESLGEGDDDEGLNHFHQRYRLPTIPLKDVVYFAIPLEGGILSSNGAVTYHNIALYLPPEGKYLVNDAIDSNYEDSGPKWIMALFDSTGKYTMKVKLQRYE